MRYILLIFTFLVCALGYTQTLKFKFVGTISNYDTKKKEGAVKVSFIQNGATLTSVNTGSNGKYQMQVVAQPGIPFEIQFSKPGFVSKKVSFDFRKMDLSDKPKNTVFSPVSDLSLELFSVRPNIDFSFLKTEPVASFQWNLRALRPIFDRVAAERIKKRIEDLLNQEEKEKADREKQYNEAIAAADLWANKKNYKNAISKYEEALLIKPKEPYPSKRIAELDALLKKQKLEEQASAKKEQEYQNLIQAGDALAEKGQNEQAIQKYLDALTKKSDPYPQAQIKKLEGLILKQKQIAAKQKSYDEAMKAAADMMTQKKYQEAKSKYIQASKIKPEEQLPNQKIAEIDALLKEQADELAKKNQYQAAITTADNLFKAKQYQKAKLKYEDASKIDPTQSYPKQQIVACDEALNNLAANQAKREKISNLLSDANTKFMGKDYQAAKGIYQEVLQLESENATAKARIPEIDRILKAEEDQALLAQKIEEKLKEANTAFASKEYDKAKKNYQELLSLDPQNRIAPAKLKEIAALQNAMKSEAEKEARFKALKQEGMTLANQKQFGQAKVKLNEALSIKQDVEIKNKLKEIAEQLAAEASKNANDAKYNSLISQAQNFESNKQLDEAISRYQEASIVKPAENLPKKKIEELRNLKKQLSSQSKLDAAYNSLMNAGNELMKQKKYLDAISKFNEAQKLKPQEKEPAIKAAEAERLEKAKGQEVDQQYEKILSVAKKKIDEKEYSRAKELLDRAGKLKPTDPRPKQMLGEIDRLERVEKNYSLKMAEAKKYADAKNYQLAIASYEGARQIKPQETEPLERIKELRALRDKEKQNATIEKKYTELIRSGDAAAISKQYSKAITYYKGALGVKPGDAIATRKIAEMEKARSANNQPKETVIEEKKDFSGLLSKADDLFQRQDYVGAKKIYDDVLSQNPQSSYARKKSMECASKISLANSSETREKYQQLIGLGDDNFSEKNYEKAKIHYRDASKILPNEEYPRRKLAEINNILNPKIVNSGKLEDLGDPYEENSLIDGQAALAKADYDRKNLKVSNVRTGVGELETEQIERGNIKQEALLRSDQEIAYYEELAREVKEDHDENRLENNELIKQIEKDEENQQIENNNYEDGDHLNSQDKFDIVKADNESDFASRKSVSDKNNHYLDEHNRLLDMENDEQGMTEKDINIESGVILKETDTRITLETRSDDDQRRRTGEKILNSDQLTSRDYNVKLNQETEEQRDAKSFIVSLDYEAESMNNDAEARRKENVAEVDMIQDRQYESEQLLLKEKKADKEYLEQMVGNVVDRIESETVERDDNRKASVEMLKENDKQIIEADENRIERNHDKNVGTKETIHAEEISRSGTDNLEQKSNALNISSIENKQNDVLIEREANQVSDNQERLRVRAGMEDLAAEIQEGGEGTDEQRRINAEAMHQVNKHMNDDGFNKSNAEKDKLLQSRGVIEKQESVGPTKVYTKNSLGEEYPEGVSQETFSNKDDKGLLSSIVTRRIVVRNGHGNVYVRTQTINGITYTKNNQPTTEYVWQRETQAADLERHY